MADNKAELLKCPFCGTDAKYYTRDAETGCYLIAPYTEHVIHCPNMSCPADCVEVARRTYEEAVTDWNTRADWFYVLPTKEEVIKYLNEILESCRVRRRNADREWLLVDSLLRHMDVKEDKD